MSTPKNIPNLVRVVDGLLKSFKNIKQQAGGISVKSLCVPSGAGTENYWPKLKLIPCKKHKYDVAAYANNDCSKLVSFAVYGKNIAAWPDLEALCEQAAKALLLIQQPQNVPGPIGIVKIWKRSSSLIGKEPAGADNVAPSIVGWFEFLFHAGREVGSRLGRLPSTFSRPGLPEADVRELGCDIVEASIIALEQVISAATPAANTNGSATNKFTFEHGQVLWGEQDLGLPTGLTVEVLKKLHDSLGTTVPHSTLCPYHPKESEASDKLREAIRNIRLALKHNDVPFKIELKKGHGYVLFPSHD
jgi:hypothetical protein